MRVMYKYTQRQEQVLSDWSFQNEHNAALLEQLVQEQETIGWENFFKGRLSKTWSLLQDKHYASLELPECQAVGIECDLPNHLLQSECMADSERYVTQRQGALTLLQQWKSRTDQAGKMVVLKFLQV